ncbi:MAG: nucleoside triphosphate pyrophosphatase [Granulosicoccus sp.]
MQDIVLASSSVYRAELLNRLPLEWSAHPPDIDERVLPGETPEALVERLASEKAYAIAVDHPLALIIGSDQVATVEGAILGKPGTLAKTCEQLSQMSGKRVRFLTAVYIVNAATGQHRQALDTTVASLRNLTSNEIKRYVEFDKPINCAGGFKVESLGVSLFQRIETRDPTALIGLPMIALCQALRELGIPLP